MEAGLVLGERDYCHSYRLKKHKGGVGVAFRHRESHLKNFCNKLLKWEWMIDVCFTPESGRL